MKQNILDNTLKSASFNVVFQVFLRCITFLLNAFVLRYISQDVVGVINVRLLLLESTILFLSREAFRRAALSQTDPKSWQQIINLMWLTVPLSILISILFNFIWLYLLNAPSSDITPHYAAGVWFVSVGCIIEMLAEPLYIVSQAYSFIKLKIVLASLVVLVRTLIFIPCIIVSPRNAVFAFSLAQIIANSVYSAGYYCFYYFYIGQNNIKKIQKKKLNILADNNSGVAFNDSQGINVEENPQGEKILNEKNETEEFSQRKGLSNKKKQVSMIGIDQVDSNFPFTSLFDFLPKTLCNQTWIHPMSAYLTWSFFKQGILKQILTEGERYTMTLFSVMTFKEQGIYDVINNLGSLVVRFLFRPVEESLYFYFTQTIRRDAKIKHQNEESMKEVSMVLSQSLNCFLDVGLVIFTFGQSYSTLLLYLYGGESIASGQGPSLLRAFSFSVLLLGINGITECYTFSTMSTHELNKYNYLMAGFSILFMVVSWALTTLFGGIGFIFANCCNMLVRILHSIMYIKARYEGSSFQPLYGLLPTKYFFTSLCVALLITKTTEHYSTSLQHFFIGMICFVLVSATWAFEKQDFINLAIKKWKYKEFKTE